VNQNLGRYNSNPKIFNRERDKSKSDQNPVMEIGNPNKREGQKAMITQYREDQIRIESPVDDEYKRTLAIK
jgi:hypothetical protein